jgi:hypothetical protein
LTESKKNRREADKIVRLTLLAHWKRGNFRRAPAFGHTLLTITAANILSIVNLCPGRDSRLGREEMEKGGLPCE